MTDLLMAWLTDSLKPNPPSDWLIDWHTDWWSVYLSDILVPDRLTEGRLTGSWNDRVDYGLATACLTDWLTGSLVPDWLSKWVTDLLIDWCLSGQLTCDRHAY